MATKAKVDTLDALVGGDAKGVIAMMLWNNRMREPDMFAKIDEEQVKAFQESCRFQKLVPDIRIFRPGGLAAQPAIPAAGNKRAVPAREAIPPKPYVVVTLVEKGTSNVIRPIENNEADYDVAQDTSRFRKAKSDAPGMARRLLEMAKTGEYSLSDIQDTADALLLLSRPE